MWSPRAFHLLHWTLDSSGRHWMQATRWRLLLRGVVPAERGFREHLGAGVCGRVFLRAVYNFFGFCPFLAASCASQLGWYSVSKFSSSTSFSDATRKAWCHFSILATNVVNFRSVRLHLDAVQEAGTGRGGSPSSSSSRSIQVGREILHLLLRIRVYRSLYPEPSLGAIDAKELSNLYDEECVTRIKSHARRSAPQIDVIPSCLQLPFWHHTDRNAFLQQANCSFLLQVGC